MRRICLLSVTCMSGQYFPTLSQKGQNFREKFMNTNVCFDFLYNFCMIHLPLKEKLSEVLSYMYAGLRVMNPVILVRF